MFIMISTKSFGNITLKKLNFGEVETPYRFISDRREQIQITLSTLVC